ncbi:MAG TPA: hypothetical protein VF011_07590 [Terriglobales bacterium]
MSEGVKSIRIIHFEGRGDPLVNADLGELILLSKQYFPDAVSMVTTHASYPYKPWLTTCGLNILRASIDGAFADSYEKYRVGGNLEKALCFLRKLRNERHHSKTPMKVIWKYILFEWNDSDEEMQHAASLATELECDLLFVLTHSPGRSKRFSDNTLLEQRLRELGVAASLESTYQLRTGVSGAVIEGSAAEYLGMVLKAALEYAHANDTLSAVEQLASALTHDPGISPMEDHGKATIRVYLNQILANARLPLTLSWLAAISREWEDGHTSALLLQRYLELAPDAPDRDNVLRDLAAQRQQARLKAALEYAHANDTRSAVEQLASALTHDPGISPMEDHGKATIRVYLNQILANARFPLTLSWLAAISREWEDGHTSALLLQRYLELAPDAPDRNNVLRDLAAQRQQANRGGLMVAFSRLFPGSLR